MEPLKEPLRGILTGALKGTLNTTLKGTLEGILKGALKGDHIFCRQGNKRFVSAARFGRSPTPCFSWEGSVALNPKP